MSYDIAKAAYLKVEELSKRVAALESKTSEPTYVTADMSFDLYLKSSGSKTVVFRTIGEHLLKLSASVPTGAINASLTFNGEAITISDGEVNAEVLPQSGENKLEFSFSGANSQWISVTLFVSGFLEEYSPERHLSSVGGDYYSYLDGGTFYLYNTQSATPLVTLYDVKHASAFYGSAGIFVVKVDRDGKAHIQRYFPNGTLYVETTANGTYSKCLVRVKGGNVILYAVAGNYLKSGYVVFSGETNLYKTNIRAKDVEQITVENSAYLLVTDIDETTYLCPISSSDNITVIGKRSAGRILSARLAHNAANPAVWYHKGGAIMEKVYDGERFLPSAMIVIADEAIITDGGTKVKRIGNEITTF